MTLGSAHQRGVGLVESGDMSSSASLIGCLYGHRGAIARTAGTTFLRTLLLLPGVYLAGGRGWRAWMGASAGSMTITAFLLFWYATQKRREEFNAAVNPPASSSPVGIAPPVIDSTVAEP